MGWLEIRFSRLAEFFFYGWAILSCLLMPKDKFVQYFQEVTEEALPNSPEW